MGIWGAVIGTLAAYITIGFVRLFDVRRFVAIDVCWGRFLVTIAILLVQAVLVSLDWYIYPVSAAAAAAYLAVNFRDIRALLSRIGARAPK